VLFPRLFQAEVQAGVAREQLVEKDKEVARLESDMEVASVHSIEEKAESEANRVVIEEMAARIKGLEAASVRRSSLQRKLLDSLVEIQAVVTQSSQFSKDCMVQGYLTGRAKALAQDTDLCFQNLVDVAAELESSKSRDKVLEKVESASYENRMKVSRARMCSAHGALFRGVRVAVPPTCVWVGQPNCRQGP
jgi:type I site-specific restriction endonuclease